MFHAGRLADGRTDMAKLIVAFRNFIKVPRKKNHGSIFFPIATTCPLWTSWSSLLVMAGV